jgi:Ca2+-binding EF-hand superfamily protein
MKTLIILLASIGLATAVWAGSGQEKPPHGKHHFGKRMFKQMDTNNDGAISVAEHEEGLQKMIEQKRVHFSNMDKDGDGSVTKMEAREAHEKMGKKPRKKGQVEAEK